MSNSNKFLRVGKNAPGTPYAPSAKWVANVFAPRSENREPLADRPKSANDSNGWIGFISNLNHVFMVHPL